MTPSEIIQAAYAYRLAVCAGDYANNITDRDSEFFRWRMLDAMQFVTDADLSDEMDEARSQCRPCFDADGYRLNSDGDVMWAADRYVVPFTRLTEAEARAMLNAQKRAA